MTAPRPRLLSLFLVLGLASLPLAQGPREVHWFAREAVLGTSFRLGVEASNRAAAEGVETAIVHEIERLSDILNVWNPESELRKAEAAGAPVEVSKELFEVLELADRYRTLSGGAFNPGIAVLTEIWKKAETAGAPPTDADLAPAKEALRTPPWTIEAGTHRVTFRPSVPVSLDALAKGYIIDRALGIPDAVTKDAEAVVLEVGGDLRVRGKSVPPTAVRDPKAPADNATPLCRLNLADAAIATSGGYARGFDIAGRHYSHLLDPRTGRPVEKVVGASVVAKDCATADALATILCVVSPEAGLSLVRKIDGAAACVTAADGTRHVTESWKKLVQAGSEAPAAGADEGSALTLEFEIQEPNAGSQGGRRRGGYRRPYVAAWVEDAEGRPVRTLCLWVEKLKWLPDLRRWNKLYKDKGRDFVDVVSSATRKPGSYSLTWDGKDDDGKAVKGKSFVVFLEVVREHGTYQLVRAPFTLDGKAVTKDLEGNVEIKKATVRYGRKPGG